jgi:hypothetical protein
MSDGAQVDWEDEDGPQESELNVPHGGSRRALLGAAGGVALATSGLLLPDWLVEETAAAEHPVRRVQHHAAQHRRKQHHRREHHREGHRRQQRDASGGYRGVQLEIINNMGRSVKVIWFGNLGKLVRQIDLADGQRAAASDKTLGIEAVLEPISGSINSTYVYFENLTVGPTRTKAWYDHTPDVIDQWFWIGTTADTSLNHYHLRLHRPDDSPNFVNLEVLLTPG